LGLMMMREHLSTFLVSLEPKKLRQRIIFAKRPHNSLDPLLRIDNHFLDLHLLTSIALL
jgi:hypothetical protein